MRALLEQVEGLDPLMIDKMMAAGLGRLAPLYAARADEIAAVTAIPDDIAAATAARVQAFHRATPAALATVDPAATVRELAGLLERLRAEHTRVRRGGARLVGGRSAFEEAPALGPAGVVPADHDRAGAAGGG